MIRPTRGSPDAIAAVLGVDGARLLVAGDPRIPLEELQARGGGRVEWRLGYLGPPELEQALAEATVAVFPYRDEPDQSGALLQALGAGVPAVVYDVGGLGEVVDRFGQAASSPRATSASSPTRSARCSTGQTSSRRPATAPPARGRR